MTIHISNGVFAFNQALICAQLPVDSEIHALVKELSSSGDQARAPSEKHDNAMIAFNRTAMGTWKGIAVLIDDSVAVFVRPEFRRRNVGSDLIRALRTTVAKDRQLKSWRPIVSERDLAFWEKVNITAG